MSREQLAIIMFGARLLAESSAVVDVLPQWIPFRVPFVWTAIVRPE
jgi:hypothetical protein